ncbi:MAG: ABC-type uncharacterized transport system involved in gliding motility auxiliary subunit [Myxococcota bacterium]|jgi:ABC-type uncharacterized transport system involved in gliding motility auxiliary subunit
MNGLPALFGALGAVAFGFGILTAILGIFQPTTDYVWVVANLTLGVLLIGGSIVGSLDSLRERMSSGEARRVGKYGSSALLGTAFTLAIICMLAFVSTRYSKRFDWTEAQMNTLSEQTTTLLERLDIDVQVTAFFNAADAPPIRDLLDRYAHESAHIQLEFADPNRRPDLVEAYGIEAEDLARGLVRIAIGEAHVDLGEFSESEITNAVLKLSSGEGRKIYFLESHNERPFAGERGTSGAGYSQAVAALRNESYEVESLFLARTGSVPEDADLLVIVGPTRPLVDQEHEALASYVASGGAALVLLDPRANTDVAQDVRAWGIEVGEDVVFDARLALFGQATTPFSGSFANHPITEKMRDTVLFHMARSIAVAEGTPLIAPIVFTGEESWAETDLASWTATGKAKFDEGDVLGPVSVVVAGEVSGDGEAPARVVVVGDSDFASNELIGNYQNRDLFVNAVNWLVDDTDQIAIRPPVSRASRFRMTGESFVNIQLLSLFVIPELIAVTGVVSWWLRRKRSVS